ncbi:MAG: hypothetical protein FWG71_07855 [Synergistaceae bacterium]|nr:hypothetical protein [Synergistaceae bacterium]
MVKKSSVLWVILALFSFVLMSGGCGGSGSGDETFDSFVSFEGFKAGVEEKYGPAPFRVGIFTGSAGGETKRNWVYAPPDERELKVPKNAEFVGIVFQIENVEGKDGNFRDWVTLRDAFVYNDKSSPERNFNNFKNVKVKLDGLEADFEFFVNDEEVDADMMVQGDPVYSFLPANFPHDTRTGTRDIHIAPLPADVETLLKEIPETGSVYQINPDYDTTFDTVSHHIQGFAYGKKGLAYTHSNSGVDLFGYHYDPVVIYEEENGTAHEHIVPNGLLHPGSVQVIGDYLFVTAAPELHGEKGDDKPGLIYAYDLSAGLNDESCIEFFTRPGDAYENSAVGITDVKTTVKYFNTGNEPTGADFTRKYIIGIIDYEANRVDIYYSNKEADSLEDLEKCFSGGVDVPFKAAPKPFNNMNLFRDVNDDIWMIGFAEGDDHSYTDLYAYKLTYDYESGGKRFLETGAEIAYTKRLKPTLPESANSISGRWGASLYFDGKNLHVFMSDRNPKTSGKNENRVFYNHWGKIGGN